MMRRVPRALMAFALLPATAAAQRVTITPTVGAYVPLAAQGYLESYECFDVLPDDPNAVPCLTFALRLRSGQGAALGVHVVWEASRVLRVEGVVATTSAERVSEMWVVEPPSTGSANSYAIPARSTAIALRIGVARPVGASAEVVVGAGLSRTTVTGAAYENEAMYARVSRRTRWGPTLACTVGIDVSKYGRVHLGVADFIYPLSVDWYVGERTKTQHDLRITVGWGIALRS